MEWNAYEKMILDEMESAVYLSETDTFRLLYMNRYCRRLLGIRDNEEDYVGRPCYEVLQGLDSPCSFCTSSRLNEHTFYTWKRYNRKLNRWFVLKDKKLRLPDGRMARLEIASDITEAENLHLMLSRKLSREETLLRCVQTLSENENMQTAIFGLLKIIGEFYGGERACIFEFSPENDTYSNTCEWCAPGAEKKQQEQQQIPLASISLCLESYREKGSFCISPPDPVSDPTGALSRVLTDLKTESLISVPLTENGTITGLIGVDNPSAGMEDLTLLTSVSYFIVNDIQKRKMTARLEKMSYIDLLTGQFNRNKYMEFLQILEDSPPTSLGIVYMDLNGLKIANDTYGHKYGDHLIKKAADMLALSFQPYVFRTGGDEFIAFCPDIDEETFLQQAETLRQTAKSDTQVNVSIGSIWETAPYNLSALITEADNQMYLEKQSYYKQSIHGEYNHSFSLSRQVLNDISEGRFLIHLQPKVELQTGKITGAEALVRRKDPSGALVMPGKFLPLYESEGLIRHIDFFVLETVCQMLRRWIDQGKTPVRITVNLSSRTLLEHDIVRKVCSMCATYNVPPELLCLKLSDITGRTGRLPLVSAFEQFLQAGFYVSATRDSASGSHVSLEQAPYENGRIRTPVSTAGAVETSDQHNRLGEAGCQYGQGYYYSSPVTVSEFEKRFLEAG